MAVPFGVALLYLFLHFYQPIVNAEMLLTRPPEDSDALLHVTQSEPTILLHYFNSPFRYEEESFRYQEVETDVQEWQDRRNFLDSRLSKISRMQARWDRKHRFYFKRLQRLQRLEANASFYHHLPLTLLPTGG